MSAASGTLDLSQGTRTNSSLLSPDGYGPITFIVVPPAGGPVYLNTPANQPINIFPAAGGLTNALPVDPNHETSVEIAWDGQLQNYVFLRTSAPMLLAKSGSGASMLGNLAAGAATPDVTLGSQATRNVADTLVSVQNAGSEVYRVDPCARDSFAAYPSSGATLPATSNSPLVFAQTRYNRGSHYDTVASAFTANAAGRYRFLAQIAVPVTAPSSATIRLKLRVNGTDTFFGPTRASATAVNSPTSGTIDAEVSATFDLAINDAVTAYVEFQGAGLGGSALANNASNCEPYSRFEGVRVPC